MQYSILIEAVTDPGFPPGYYYAHIPALDLTTHGLGIEGAKAAARDLIGAWIEERKAHGEAITREADSYFAHIEIEDALLGA
jgi:predicted RNase H-like HicB family nuclease